MLQVWLLHEFCNSNSGLHVYMVTVFIPQMQEMKSHTHWYYMYVQLCTAGSSFKKQIFTILYCLQNLKNKNSPLLTNAKKYIMF